MKPLPREMICKLGNYTAYRGKLSGDDARQAYVTGPCRDGSIRPIASFWSPEEAIRYVKERG